MFRATQDEFAKILDLDFFMLPLLVFGKHEKSWRSELKKLLSRYVTFLSSGNCLPQNG